MKKKNDKPDKKPAKTEVRAAAPALQKDSLTRILLPALLILTFLVFLPALKNGYVFWDDPEYVTKNPFIKGVPLSTHFTTYYMGNYHPLTMLSYCLEYKLFGLSPFGYHLDK